MSTKILPEDANATLLGIWGFRNPTVTGLLGRGELELLARTPEEARDRRLEARAQQPLADNVNVPVTFGPWGAIARTAKGETLDLQYDARRGTGWYVRH